MAQPPVTKFEAHPPANRTFARQGELPKLPIPPLKDTLDRYLNALVGLQDEHEHARTRAAVEDFLHGEGPRLQERLIEWAKTKDRRVARLRSLVII
jgi:carnitine O-acetyltransferase